MAASQTCPICQGPIQATDSACPRCGFKLIGATQAFEPVEEQIPQPASAQDDVVPVLKVVKGPYNGQEFIMGEGAFTVGRDPSCDLFLSNMTVSRLHATITISGRDAQVRDEGSTNGTWVNGNVVDAAPLHAGERLQIGTFEMVFDFKQA